MFLKKYIGKQLHDVAQEIKCGARQGICVFQLKDETDKTGKRVAEDFDLRDILSDKPELKTKTIKLVNDFYGEYIFRVL